MSLGCVIVGAGHGGFQAANALREAGYAHPITLIDAGAGVPYERPPLSKKYLLGEIDRETLAFRSASFYADAEIRLLQNTRVVGIDRAQRVVTLESNEGGDRTDVPGATTALGYDSLVLAMGSTPRPLDVIGADHPAVHRLATIADAESVGAALAGAKRLLVVGSGFIGLESAAVGIDRGLEVTVLHRGDGVLSRSVSAPVAEYVSNWHRDRGVVFAPNTTLSEIREHADPKPGARVTAIDSNGVEHDADLVIVGVGANPVTDLAELAGLAVDEGVVVDGHLRTSDARIFAVGDCARFPHQLFGDAMRLESVQNATDHARTVARALTEGADPYCAVPWFWSDQGDLKLQIAGFTAGADATVVRGDPGSGRFSVFAYSDGVLVGVDSVRKAADHVLARKLLARSVTPTAEQAADLGFEMKTLAA